jgi:putative ABC transport system permease protein
VKILKRFYSYLIRFWFSAQMAWHGILAKPLRSALTILGVTIGVASVVSLMGIGEGARQSVVRQFESLGSNVIVIKALQPNVEFLSEEAEELVERVEGINLATPVVQSKANMKWRRARGTVDLLGVNEQFPDVRDHKLLTGQFFSKFHVELRSPVAVLGYNIGAGLLDGRDPVGKTFTLDNTTYRILGVLEPKGTGQGENIDDKILIPYTSAQRIAEKKTVEEIWAKADSAQEADLAVVQLGRIFRRKLGLDQSAPTPVLNENQIDVAGEASAEAEKMAVVKEEMAAATEGYSVPEQQASGLPTGQDLLTITSLNQLVDEADKANRIMTLLLGGIAAVSLLVGGLGIMNIMLVAVTERTGEIGLRRALGAKQADLLVQFLLEALYLSGMGAIVGVAVAIWGMNVFSNYGFESVISLQAVEIACGVALGSGLLFGVYPAITASSVPPVEALRR